MPAFQRLQTGYNVRNPTGNDIPGIVDLIYEHELAETGKADRYELDDIRADWENLESEHDAWLVVAPDGSFGGYGTLTAEQESGRIEADGYVHPAHYGRGIGSTLIELMEARAEQLVPAMPEGIRIVLVNNVIVDNEAALTLLESHGYNLQRVFFRMHILMEKPPQAPVWPQGITARVCNGSEEDIVQAYETIEEGFKDHWAHTPRSFEFWRRYMVEREDFDPSLWFFAVDEASGAIAGALLGRVREEENGWIQQLAVLRPWRRRGLGEALLRHAFTVFYQRDIKQVGLGVDGQSLTGAQRLYERVGMHVTMRIGRYEKELRPGKDVLER